MDTWQKILEDTQRLIAQKTQKSASDTEGLDQVPGANKNKPVPEELRKDDVGMSDKKTSPKSEDTEGLKGKLESDESPVAPKEVPMTGDDDAAKLANEILSLVRDGQKKIAEAAKQAAQAKQATQDKQTTQTKQDDQKSIDTATKKADKGLQMELTSDVLAKIAALVLATEEGAKMTESILEKIAGAQAAEEILTYLAEQAELAEKQAAYEAGYRDAEAILAKLAEEIENNPEVAASLLGGEGADDQGSADGAAVTENAPDSEVTVGDVADAVQELVEEGQLSAEEGQQILAEIIQAVSEEDNEEES